MIYNVNQQLITEDITLYSLPDELEDLVSWNYRQGKLRLMKQLDQGTIISYPYPIQCIFALLRAKYFFEGKICFGINKNHISVR